MAADKHTRYNRSAKGRARNRRYNHSVKGKARLRRYNHGAVRHATNHRYQARQQPFGTALHDLTHGKDVLA